LEQELLERILAELAKGSYQDEVKRARQTFFELLKDMREDDPSYERLTGCFLNWYIFDRPMDCGRGTPLQIFAAGEDLSSEERVLLASMSGNIHSLFEVLRIEDTSVNLRDLFSTETIKVTERRSLAGLDPGDILEARLLPISDKLVFSSGAFILHPRPARRLIRQAIERCRRDGSPSRIELIRRLQSLSFRYTDRFNQRIPVEKVYAEIVPTTG